MLRVQCRAELQQKRKCEGNTHAERGCTFVIWPVRASTGRQGAGGEGGENRRPAPRMPKSASCDGCVAEVLR